MTRAERTARNTLHSTGAVRSQSPVADVISRDRLVIASCIVVITALAWTYLVHLSSQKMPMPICVARQPSLAMKCCTNGGHIAPAA